MALTRLNEFNTGTTLTEAALEGDLDNIYANALSLISPLTGNLAAGGFIITGLGLGTVSSPSLQLTGDANTGIYSSAADTMDVATGGVRAASFGASFLLSAAPEDARTATVDVAGEVRSTTSGSPAAGIGVGLLFSAESADENPSEFGRLDFAASDVGAGTEDTYASVLLRVAGRALDEKYQFGSTAGEGFTAIFAHAVTADRTYTLPNVAGGVLVSTTTGEFVQRATFDPAATAGASTIYSGGASSPTFAVAFSATPFVAWGGISDNMIQGAMVFNVSTTGFSSRMFGTVDTQDATDGRYIALGA